MKLGIIREQKSPPDKRVPFSPQQCVDLQKEFPGLEVIIQSSSIRCFSDEEYKSLGLKVVDDISGCDILMGIKEVPVEYLISGKRYLFFSHTIKKQPHNQKLMKAIIDKRIEMIDYETLTDKQLNRIIGFGRYAGIVGAYNGLLGYGLKYNLFELKPAYLCSGRIELLDELKKVKLPNIKICMTGGGRVANGVIETLSALNIRKVTPYEFLNNSYREAVYCQLHSKDYYEAKDGTVWNNDFYKHPENYYCTFLKYTKVTDLLITTHFWSPGAPKLFFKNDMRQPDFRISVIADISCDMDGSVPSTLRASSIGEAFYGYDPMTEKEDMPFGKNSVTVMAVDNLPCELPRDASEDFGKDLIERVIPSLLGKDETGIIERATIAKDGNLMPRFEYLKDYIS